MNNFPNFSHHASPTAQTLMNVFSILNDKEIRYCSWKSNLNLFKSFQCETDIDLLVSADDVHDFKQAITKLGIEQRYSTSDKTYAGMEDYLGIDDITGKLFHLHVHYKLIVGKKFQKNYRIPIEALVLNSSIWDATFPIRIIKPEFELLLLLLRIFLKLDVNSLIQKSPIPLNIRKEYKFLIEKSDRIEFIHISDSLFPELSGLFNKLIDGNLGKLTGLELLRFKLKIKKSLKKYRIFSKREILIVARIKKAAHNHSKSWTSRGGVSIAFVGADGSGKSSSVDHIGTWLGWKLSVAPAYMGLPKNKLWTIINGVDKITARIKWTALNKGIVIFKWLFVAGLRYKTFLKSERKKNQGKIVLFDRYPLMGLWDADKPMDGPRLAGFNRWEALEKKIYKKIDLPDYVIFLKVAVDEAINRKNGLTSISYKNKIAGKVESIDRLISTNKNNFFIIDTSKGREKTLLEIKRAIWRWI